MMNKIGMNHSMISVFLMNELSIVLDKFFQNRGGKMKIMQVVLVTLSLCLAYSVSWGTSIVYDGLQCQSTFDPDDPTPLGTSVQSRFEVIEEAGGGLYRLRLTGGIPRVADGNNSVCIDSATALGYFGIGEVDVLPNPLDSADATAYFNGQDLIITINAMVSDLTQRRLPLSIFYTSRIFAYSYTLFLEFNPQLSQFTLKKMIRNRGYTQTNGSTNSITPFFETVLPSFNSELPDRPKILTPIPNIEYRLE